MENNEHVSIEMEKLADSLKEKLDSLLPLSKHPSIYRVPERTRSLHPTHYTPQVIAIGPFHHGKEELKAMEEHKQRYLYHFLQRTQVRMASFLAFIKEREPRLRNCYAETIHFESDEFVTMVLVDAVFLIELFLRYSSDSFKTDDDRIFGNSILVHEIYVDLRLLENQFPIFILNDLFNLAKTATYDDDSYEKFPFATIAYYWFNTSMLPLDENLWVTNFCKAEHFLHLFILSLHPPSQEGSQKRLNDRNILGATELHQAGVKFKSMPGNNLFDIGFNEGILEIPSLTIFGETEVFLRSLQTFETIHGNTRYINDYILLMSSLIRSPKDAELLIQNGVLELGDSEPVATVFYSLGSDTLYRENDFQYSDVVANLQAHCKKRRNKWKAALKQNYFNTPWASISVIAAVILLLLTFTQTVSSIIAL